MYNTYKIGNSMSKNATKAYSNGEKPWTQWKKHDIINTIKPYIKIPIEEFKTLNINSLKAICLTYTGIHHTSALAKETLFYRIEESVVEKITSKDITKMLLKQNELKKSIKNKTKDEVLELNRIYVNEMKSIIKERSLSKPQVEPMELINKVEDVIIENDNLVKLNVHEIAVLEMIESSKMHLLGVVALLAFTKSTGNSNINTAFSGKSIRKKNIKTAIAIADPLFKKAKIKNNQAIQTISMAIAEIKTRQIELRKIDFTKIIGSNIEQLFLLNLDITNKLVIKDLLAKGVEKRKRDFEKRYQGTESAELNVNSTNDNNTSNEPKAITVDNSTSNFNIPHEALETNLTDFDTSVDELIKQAIAKLCISLNKLDTPKQINISEDKKEIIEKLIEKMNETELEKLNAIYTLF